MIAALCIMARCLLAISLLSCLRVSGELIRRSSNTYTELIDRKCSSPGKRCSLNCTQVETCWEASDGSVIPLLDTVCSNGELCDEIILGCSPNMRSCPYPYICTSNGVFPDPFDCTQYYVCLGNSPAILVTCEDGFAFDSSTGNCSLKTTDNPAVCKYAQVPACTHDGQSGPLKWNTKFYYRCDEGIPVIYKCDDGDFDTTTLKCAVAKCENTGLSTDPANCSSYYSCEKGESSQHRHCPDNTYYSPDLYACLPDRSVCISSSHYPNTCEETGYYADLLQCNSYYLCIKGLQPKHENCFANYYFNPELKLCVIGTCDNN